MSTAEDRSRAVGPLDAVLRDPDHHDVLMENEHVRVLGALLRPGGQTEIHIHVWPSALYVLSWCDFVRIDPEGKVLADSRTMGLRPRPGEAIWSPVLPPRRMGWERRPAAHRGRAQVGALRRGQLQGSWAPAVLPGAGGLHQARPAVAREAGSSPRRVAMGVVRRHTDAPARDRPEADRGRSTAFGAGPGRARDRRRRSLRTSSSESR